MQANPGQGSRPAMLSSIRQCGLRGRRAAASSRLSNRQDPFHCPPSCPHQPYSLKDAKGLQISLQSWASFDPRGPVPSSNSSPRQARRSIDLSVLGSLTTSPSIGGAPAAELVEVDGVPKTTLEAWFAEADTKRRGLLADRDALAFFQRTGLQPKVLSKACSPHLQCRRTDREMMVLTWRSGADLEHGEGCECRAAGGVESEPVLHGSAAGRPRAEWAAADGRDRPGGRDAGELEGFWAAAPACTAAEPPAEVGYNDGHCLHPNSQANEMKCLRTTEQCPSKISNRFC